MIGVIYVFPKGVGRQGRGWGGWCAKFAPSDPTVGRQ